METLAKQLKENGNNPDYKGLYAERLMNIVEDYKERMKDELKDIIYDLGIDSQAETEREYRRIWESIDTAILHNQPEEKELKKKTKVELVYFIYDLYRDIDNLR